MQNELALDMKCLFQEHMAKVWIETNVSSDKYTTLNKMQFEDTQSFVLSARKKEIKCHMITKIG